MFAAFAIFEDGWNHERADSFSQMCSRDEIVESEVFRRRREGFGGASSFLRSSILKENQLLFVSFGTAASDRVTAALDRFIS